MEAVLRLPRRSVEKIVRMLGDPDPFLVSAALYALGRPAHLAVLKDAARSTNPRVRLGALLALRRLEEGRGRDLLAKFLDDTDPEVRRAAVQWVGEERLTRYKDAIARAAAKAPVKRDLFEAMLASQALLDGKKWDSSVEPSGEVYVAVIVKDAKQPAVFRTLALRMLRPDHPALKPALLKELLADHDEALRAQAARTLAQRGDDASQKMLRTLARDPKAYQEDLRSDAILGLAQSAPTSKATRRLLLSLLAEPKYQSDALRSLRGAGLDADERRALFAWWDKLPAEKVDPSDERRELAAQVLLVLGTKAEKDEGDRRKALTELAGPRPGDEKAWRAALTGKGDAAAGERVFFHARGPRCAVCHRIDGRGGQVGPDLSLIARSQDHAKLLDSILTPSKEIAPAFTTWVFHMRDGKTHIGVLVSENFDSTLTVADAEGKRIVLKRLDVEQREASPKSLMPDDLPRLMTRREFLDLLAYLEERR
jgi:putative heme-binding domain-containing protein